MKRMGCLLSSVFVLPLVFSGCSTDFLDDFEDGVVNPAYSFVVGDASLLAEGDVCGEGQGCLRTTENVYLFLPFIPGEAPWARTPITPGVGVDLDVLEVAPSSIVELGVVDDADNPREFYALRVEVGPASDTLLTCYDETERLPLEGTLSFPMHLSVRVDDGGGISGQFADGISAIDCPLGSTLSSEALDPATVLWAGEENGYAGVDNFHVKLD